MTRTLRSTGRKGRPKNPPKSSRRRSAGSKKRQEQSKRRYAAERRREETGRKSKSQLHNFVVNAKRHYERGGLSLDEVVASVPGFADAQCRRTLVACPGQGGSTQYKCSACTAMLLNEHSPLHHCTPLELDSSSVAQPEYERKIEQGERRVARKRLAAAAARAAAQSAEAAAAADELQRAYQQVAKEVQQEKEKLLAEKAAAEQGGKTFRFSRLVCRVCGEGITEPRHGCIAYFCTNFVYHLPSVRGRSVDSGERAAEEAHMAKLLKEEVLICSPLPTVEQQGKQRPVIRRMQYGPLRCFHMYSCNDGELGWGLAAACRATAGAYGLEYAGVRQTAAERQADADPYLAGCLVDSYSNIFVQPSGTACAARLANNACGSARSMDFVKSILDEERVYRVGWLRLAKDVQPGDRLTWTYRATTDCEAEQQAVMCKCERCKGRKPLFQLGSNPVAQCGTCHTCRAAAAVQG